jgi:hypothetical protein
MADITVVILVATMAVTATTATTTTMDMETPIAFGSVVGDPDGGDRPIHIQGTIRTIIPITRTMLRHPL